MLYNILYFLRFTGFNNEQHIHIFMSSQPSFYNIVHIPTVTVTFLKYINILYVTLFKLLITQQVYNVSSVTRYLKSGIKSIKNFQLTSLSLYITLINITLIIVNNCSMLNPGPDIASNHPDIVVLNETWLKETVKNSEFFPDNDYKVFRLDRNYYIKQGFEHIGFFRVI